MDQSIPMQKPFFLNPRCAASAACLAAVLLLSACAPASTPAASDGNTSALASAPTMDMPTQASASPSTGTLPAIPVTGSRVTISNFTFSPQTLTVAVGTTVTWVNQDDTAHTVTSADKKFASQALDTGDTFSFKFTTPGTYSYFCTLHPQMVGKIIVK